MAVPAKKAHFIMTSGKCRIWIMIVGLASNLVNGLSPVRVKSRDAVEVGKSTTLHCDYFLDNVDEELFSLVWYWTPSSELTGLDFRFFGPAKKSSVNWPELPDRTVAFFRYWKNGQEGEQKKAWANNVLGIFDINVHGSTGTSVLLDRVSLNAVGTFECEVTTYPEFITKRGFSYMSVARIPDHWERPEVKFHPGHHQSKLRFEPGEAVEVECISKGGYPPPKMAWFINGEKAESLGLDIQHFPPMVSNETNIDDWVNWNPMTSSRLRFVIDTNVMSSGNLKIKCVVFLFQLYHQSNEVSIETLGLKPKPNSIIQQSWQQSAQEFNQNDHYTNNADGMNCSVCFLFINIFLLYIIK